MGSPLGENNFVERSHDGNVFAIACFGHGGHLCAMGEHQGHLEANLLGGVRLFEALRQEDNVVGFLANLVHYGRVRLRLVHHAHVGVEDVLDQQIQITLAGLGQKLSRGHRPPVAVDDQLDAESTVPILQLDGHVRVDGHLEVILLDAVEPNPKTKRTHGGALHLPVDAIVDVGRDRFDHRPFVRLRWLDARVAARLECLHPKFVDHLLALVGVVFIVQVMCVVGLEVWCQHLRHERRLHQCAGDIEDYCFGLAERRGKWHDGCEVVCGRDGSLTSNYNIRSNQIIFGGNWQIN